MYLSVNKYKNVSRCSILAIFIKHIYTENPSFLQSWTIQNQLFQKFRSNLESNPILKHKN